MQLWLARPISQAVLAAKQFRPLNAHKGEDLAFEPLRHILAGKDMLLYHASQFSRGEEKMSSFFCYVGSLRIAWVYQGSWPGVFGQASRPGQRTTAATHNVEHSPSDRTVHH